MTANPSDPASLLPTSPPITFYRANERPFGAFSNLYRRPILFDGRDFPTAEHAYQFGKARKPAVAEWLMAAPTPSLLAGAAHSLLHWDIAPGWSRSKVERMERVLRAKFTQHADLADLLRSTGTARLVEAGTVANEVNLFWGEVDGRGKNTLGELLMLIRSQLAEAPHAV